MAVCGLGKGSHLELVRRSCCFSGPGDAGIKEVKCRVVGADDFRSITAVALGQGPLDVLAVGIEEVEDLDDISGISEDNSKTIVSVNVEVGQVNTSGFFSIRYHF